MASYTLIGNASIVQVLSPKVSQDVVVATIQTIPTGIIAATVVPQTAFDDGTAAAELAAFADAIEAVIAEGQAVGGSGTSSLDASGLTQFYVTFTVVYNPPGAPVGTVTADVDVPVALLSVAANVPGVTRRMWAGDLVTQTYNSLVALAGGASAPAATATAAPAPADGVPSDG